MKTYKFISPTLILTIIFTQLQMGGLSAAGTADNAYPQPGNLLRPMAAEERQALNDVQVCGKKFLIGTHIVLKTPSSRKFIEEAIAKVMEEKDVDAKVKEATDIVRKQIRHIYRLFLKEEETLEEIPPVVHYGAKLSDIIDSGWGLCMHKVMVISLILDRVEIPTQLHKGFITNIRVKKGRKGQFKGRLIFEGREENAVIWHTWLSVLSMKARCKFIESDAFIGDLTPEELYRSGFSRGRSIGDFSQEELSSVVEAHHKLLLDGIRTLFKKGRHLPEVKKNRPKRKPGLLIDDELIAVEERAKRCIPDGFVFGAIPQDATLRNENRELQKNI